MNRLMARRALAGTIALAICLTGGTAALLGGHL